MSTSDKVFWLRVALKARVSVRSAIDFLVARGADFARAVRYVLSLPRAVPATR